MYLVTLSSISGDARDSLEYHNARQFSTSDKENDEHQNKHCLKIYESALWYKNCYWSSLNGRYSQKPEVTFGHGIQWRAWKEAHYSLKKSEIKTRPRAF